MRGVLSCGSQHDVSPRFVKVNKNSRWKAGDALQTELDDGPHDGVLLGLVPGIEEPIVSVSEGEGEFTDVEEVLRVPVISGRSEVVGRVTGGVLRGRSKVLDFRRRTKIGRNAHEEFAPSTVSPLGILACPVSVTPVCAATSSQLRTLSPGRAGGVDSRFILNWTSLAISSAPEPDAPPSKTKTVGTAL